MTPERKEKRLIGIQMIPTEYPRLSVRDELCALLEDEGLDEDKLLEAADDLLPRVHTEMLRLSKEIERLQKLPEDTFPSDGPCMDCGRFIEPSFVSCELWEKVSGRSDGGGLLCCHCFEVRAHKRGVFIRPWRTVEAQSDEDTLAKLPEDLEKWLVKIEAKRDGESCNYEYPKDRKWLTTTIRALQAELKTERERNIERVFATLKDMGFIVDRAAELLRRNPVAPDKCQAPTKLSPEFEKKLRKGTQPGLSVSEEKP